MARRNYKYPCTVDLGSVPMRGGHYSWLNSIGCIVPFDFDNGGLVGEFRIVDYKIPDGMKNKHLFVEYNGKLLKPILTDSFVKGRFSNILSDYYVIWDYNIGDIVGENNNLIVIDRKRERLSDGYLHKFYKIKCMICGFDSGPHYKREEYREEYWIGSNDLSRLKKCPCCANIIAVTGVNDFNTLCPELTKYLVVKDKGDKIIKRSSVPIVAKCPDCGEMKIVTGALISDSGGLSCRCKDHVSLPNKVGHYFFKQLLNDHQIEEYIWEYNPD